MRAATEGHLPPVIPQGNLVEVLGREVRKGSPGQLMVESSPSRQRRPPCKTRKEMSDEAADAAALPYLLTSTSGHSQTRHSCLLDAISSRFLSMTHRLTPCVRECYLLFCAPIFMITFALLRMKMSQHNLPLRPLGSARRPGR